MCISNMLVWPGRKIQIFSPSQDCLCLVLSAQSCCIFVPGNVAVSHCPFSCSLPTVAAFYFSPFLLKSSISSTLSLSLIFYPCSFYSCEGHLQSLKIDNSRSLMLFPVPHCHSPASVECKHVRIQAMLVQMLAKGKL